MSETYSKDWPIEAKLAWLYDSIEVKRVRITTFDGYGKETFQCFDSFNLGIGTALDLVGCFMNTLENERRTEQALIQKEDPK